MGLEGTLKVFSLPDIFQILGLQRKTGVLTVQGSEDTITISFRDGQVVSAQSAAHPLANRIGGLLVRAGRIGSRELDRMLEQQKQTGQRLGSLLLKEGLVTPEDLAAARRLQTLRIVFGALLWSDGGFRFGQETLIEHAEEIPPAATESILMEAAQMLDEWPLLEKKVGFRESVYRRAASFEDLRLVTSPDQTPEGALKVSGSEAETWKWIDGSRSVAEIAERAFLSDFDVYKGLTGLLDRSLIERAPASRAAPAPVRPPAAPRLQIRTIALWAALPLIAGLAVYAFPRNRWNLLLLPLQQNTELAGFWKSVSLGRLARIERAIRVFYDSSGQYPRSLDALVRVGILSAGDLRDPYGRPYRYILRSDDGKFGLYGRNSTGNIDLDLSFDRSLAAVAEPGPASSRARQPDKRPAVQILE